MTRGHRIEKDTFSNSSSNSNSGKSNSNSNSSSNNSNDNDINNASTPQGPTHLCGSRHTGLQLLQLPGLRFPQLQVVLLPGLYLLLARVLCQGLGSIIVLLQSLKLLDTTAVHSSIVSKGRSWVDLQAREEEGLRRWRVVLSMIVERKKQGQSIKNAYQRGGPSPSVFQGLGPLLCVCHVAPKQQLVLPLQDTPAQN